MTEELNEDKILECKEVFDLFDKDKDGAISTRELGDVMRALGALPTQAELQEMIYNVDKENTGKIKFEDFTQLYLNLTKEEQTGEDLIEAFKIFDKEGKGVISANDLRNVLTTLGEKLSEDEAEELIRLTDVKGDGMIKYDDFIRIMMIK